MTMVYVLRFDERYEQSITVGVFSSVQNAKDFCEEHMDEITKSLIFTGVTFTAPWVDWSFEALEGATRTSSDELVTIDITPYKIDPTNPEEF